MPRRNKYVKQHEKKIAAIHDDIFFTKDQVTVGTMLLNMGRLDPMSEWVIIKIRTGFDLNTKKAYNVEQVRHIKDDLYLKRVGGVPETRVIKFAGASYSAVWRLLGSKANG